MKSQFCNPCKVGEFTRENAIRMYEQFLDCSPELNQQVQSLSGKRLVCHCSKALVPCIIRKSVELRPNAFDRNATTQRAPTSDELNLLARQRQEPPSDGGSSADDSVP